MSNPAVDRRFIHHAVGTTNCSPGIERRSIIRRLNSTRNPRYQSVGYGETLDHPQMKRPANEGGPFQCLCFNQKLAVAPTRK